MGISLSAWRARIGTFVGLHIGRTKGNEGLYTFKAKLVIFLAYLLLIGGVEPNPGPDIDDVYKLLSDFKLKTEDNFKSVNDRISGIECGLNDKLLKHEEDITLLQQENATLRSVVGKLESKLDDLENRSRRENLIFHGITEGQQDNESWRDCKRLVLDVIRDKLKLSNVKEEDIARAHRIGHRRGDRPIIVKFANYVVKENVLYARAALKGTDIFINEDFSLRVRKERAVLLEQLKTARERGYTATLSFNKLKINGKLFKYDWEEDKVVEIRHKEDMVSKSDDVEEHENYSQTNERRQTRLESRRMQEEVNKDKDKGDIDSDIGVDGGGGSGGGRGGGGGGSGSGGRGGGGGGGIAQWLQNGRGTGGRNNKRGRNGK